MFANIIFSLVDFATHHYHSRNHNPVRWMYLSFRHIDRSKGKLSNLICGRKKWRAGSTGPTEILKREVGLRGENPNEHIPC